MTKQAAHPKALLAEDDIFIRELVSTYLERLGYEVLEAKNGGVALDILLNGQTGPLDLIVTDLLMPKASGETVIKTARQNGLCNRFLVMSGTPDTQAEGRTPNDDSLFIEKPFTFVDFQSKLETIRDREIARPA